MIEHFREIFNSTYFMPHGSCYLWKPGLVGLHVASDVVIALSYYSIPVLLFYFVSKREDLPFNWIFLLFAAFIISCGTNHVLEIWTLWHPDYWVSGFSKLVTALVSAYTAFQLVPLLPKALALPSPAELEAANQALSTEISERKLVEKELRDYKENLEKLVSQRTIELAKINEKLQEEITERTASEKKLAQLLTEVETVNQELDSFAYIVSHDLKAPLRGIDSLANWFLEDYGDRVDSEGKELLNLLKTRVEKMHNLIDGILQYSRVGRLEEEKQVVNLNVLLEDVIDMIDPPKEIEIQIQEKLPNIIGEKIRLQQLFQNLLSNAIKFIDKPFGKITIGYVEDGDDWKFSVSDNGIGIDAEHHFRIFQVFQKLSAESNSTGIGLAVVNKIVDLHGGKIWVESEVGQGSTFFFTLPKSACILANAPVLQSTVNS